MKIKKQISFWITLTIIFSILYIIFAVKPLGTEYQFTPEWKIDVASPVIRENTENLPLHYFKLGQSCGYFTDDGTVTNFQTYPFKCSISDYYYTVYNLNNESTDFFTPDGKKAGTIKKTGFPKFTDKHIFVFLPGGGSFAYCNEKGTKVFQHDSPSPITAFDSTESGIAVGYADGNIMQFDYAGNIIQHFAPGGSSYPVIAGVSISSNGKMLASVSGQKKQRFTIAKQNDTFTKIIFHEYIDEDDTRQQIVKFSKDDKLAFYTTKTYAGIVEIESGKSAKIPVKGHAVSLKENDSSFFLLTRDKDLYTVYIIEKFATLTGSFSFKARAAFIEADGNNFYIGRNSTISKIKISRD